ncbi:MAG: esterase-like activity of phytase family protein [Bauldia sp.]|nr:esterase-like activity of phytase family protein [Bauldia sp.]
MRRFRRAFAAAALLAGAAGPALAQGLEPIEIEARPIAHFQFASSGEIFGELEYRGGLELRSSSRTFGALSGIDYDEATNTIVAVEDTGHWFTGTLVEENGRLVGVADARVGPMLDNRGDPLGVKWASDAESVRLTNGPEGPSALVSFEQANEVRRFMMPDLGTARATILRMPDVIETLRANRGLEAMAIPPPDSPIEGGIVLIAERYLDQSGNHRGWIVGGANPGAFTIRRIGSYDITDADFAPNGDLFVLERLFSIGEGIGMRIRRIAAANLVPGALADGIVVMEADLRHQIDNMEGLAIREGANGETIVMLVSDNNHSILQRTLLLQFAWHETVPPLPPPRPPGA